MTEHNPKQMVFYVYGVELTDDRIDELFDDGDGEHIHEAADAATVVFNELKARDRFEWADDITGVALGWLDE